MQHEHYSRSADQSNTFSDSCAECQSRRRRSRATWWQLRAQWQITKLLASGQLERPDHRSPKNYPKPVFLQQLMHLLCMSAKRDTGEVRTGINKLTVWMGLASSSRRKVQRALKFLREDFGLLEIARMEAPGTPRKYRVTVGWADSEQEDLSSDESAAVEQPFELSKTTAIKRAYRAARLMRHDTNQIAPLSSSMMGQLLRLIEELRDSEAKQGAELCFADVADDLMSLYMRLPGRDDRGLVLKKHPLEWIGWYLADLDSGLRRLYRKRRQPQQAEAGERPASAMTYTHYMRSLPAIGPVLKKASGAAS